ncbi:tyrosine-type recombinase/integrase [Roseobacter ponti]|uniref:Tyrosine-type recombinase/integrase n=1 Tax=Roseobacter ponti TaxID=1891787 RepID=A0A858SPZ6_9RHOB|nr:tyrosine-type recombinase/integrase [Roseobacter ponti]
MSKIQLPAIKPKYRPWNKGRLIGQRRPLLAKQVSAIRARLELSGNLRDLALFNLAVNSKLRGCDLVRLKVSDLVAGDRVRERVSVFQSRTNRPVQFEVSENTRDSIWNWDCCPEMLRCIYLFPGRFHDRPHVSTRQHARLVRNWVAAIGLDPSGYGTHSLRRTKAALIYRKTGNLRAVQLLLGHTKVLWVSSRRFSKSLSGKDCAVDPPAVSYRLHGWRRTSLRPSSRAVSHRVSTRNHCVAFLNCHLTGKNNARFWASRILEFS